MKIFDWLSYDPAHPLTFLDHAFWVFFPIVLAVAAILESGAWKGGISGRASGKGRAPKIALRNAWLFAASLFFYWKTSGWFFGILLFSTGSDFLIGHLIHRSGDTVRRKWWLALSVALNLGLLAYFKYAYFIADTWAQIADTATAASASIPPANILAQTANSLLGTGFSVDRILLPVGISFYTFQTISYAVDVYRKKVEPVGRLTDFGFYVSFFPQLVAGPIVRAADFIPQLHKPYNLSRAAFGAATFQILGGLLKKVVLADWIASNFNDRVFSDPLAHSGFEVLMAMYGYSLQVYADFSGYTDIAIGLAMLMGFSLPRNFNSPYKAEHVGQFWQRWHMSLSGWLKDYLYIPMGGNRGASLFTAIAATAVLGLTALMFPGPDVLIYGGLTLGIWWGLARLIPRFRRWTTTNVNIWLTMLIGGLWHGASWNFVAWGALNGIGISIYKIWKKVSPWSSLGRFTGIFITFHFITFTRIWFRTGSHTTWANFGSSHAMESEWTAALHVLGKVFSSTPWQVVSDVLVHYGDVFAVMLAGYIIHWLPGSVHDVLRQRFVMASHAVQLALGLAVGWIAYEVLALGGTPFIYFQF